MTIPFVAQTNVLNRKRRSQERLARLKKGTSLGPDELAHYLSDFENIRSKLKSSNVAEEDMDLFMKELGLDAPDAFQISWVAVQEFLVYVVFLCLFTVVLLSSRPDQYTFFFRDRLNNELFESPPSQDVTNTFDGVDTWYKFWYWINGDPRNGLPGPFRSTVWQTVHYGNIQAQPGLIMDSDIVVGGIRFRQCRVVPQPCETPPGFENRPMTCSPRFSPSTESKAPYGPNNRFVYSSHYSFLKTLAPAMYWGIVDNYGGGGFSVDIPWNDANMAQAIFDELIDDQWIDDKTRAVYIDFSMYDPNSQLFGVVQILFEFLYTGGVMPSYTLYSVRIFRYITAWDHFVMALEISFVLFLFYFIFIEVKEVCHALRPRKDGRDGDTFKEYVLNFWNWIDWVNIFIFLIVIMIRISYLIRLSTVQKGFDVNRMDYIDLLPLAYWQETETNINALNGFLCYIKIFKYISVIPSMDSLFATLAKAAKDIALFLIMFFIVFFGFVASFYVCFSSKLAAFRSVSQSAFSLLRTIMGDFDFIGLQNANRFMGPMLFISFQILVFFFLVNMFLAIVNNAYADVQKDTESTLLAKIKFQFAMKNIKASVKDLKASSRGWFSRKFQWLTGKNEEDVVEEEMESYDIMEANSTKEDKLVFDIRESIKKAKDADKSHEKVVEHKLDELGKQLNYLENLIIEQAKTMALKIHSNSAMKGKGKKPRRPGAVASPTLSGGAGPSDILSD